MAQSLFSITRESILAHRIYFAYCYIDMTKDRRTFQTKVVSKALSTYIPQRSINKPINQQNLTALC